MRSHDWAASPLGPPEAWPQSLRSVVGLLLSSKFPMFAAWGSELGFLYNDAYAEILGAKHPAALGSRFRDVWHEIWPDILPLIETALTGEATYRQDLPLVMNRRGFAEQTWFTFSYSPLRDESGAVAGMFCAVAETTDKVVAERRNTFRLDLEQRLRDLADPVQIMATATEALGRELSIARVGYGEIDEAEEHVIVERDWTDGRIGSVAGRYRMDDFGPEIIAELKARQTMWVDDVEADPRVGPSAAAFAAISTRSVLAVPLFKEERFVAMLYLHHPEPHPWEASEIALAEEVVERTWAAVERARAETRLRESERELRTLTDALPVLVTSVDRDQKYRFNNKAYEDWFGRRRDEILGRKVAEVVGEAAYEHLRPQIERALSGERFTFEQLLPYKDGGARHVRSDFVPRRGAAGEVDGYYALVQDVSSSRAAEAALRESEARLRALTDNLPSGMVYQTETSPDGTGRRFLFVSQSHEKLTGVPADKVLADPMAAYSLIVPEHRSRMADAEAAAIRDLRPFDVEVQFRRADGQLRWCRIISAPREQPDGSVIWDGIQIDISDQKQAEEALRVLNQELKSRVSERTAELDQLWNLSEDMLARADYTGTMSAVSPAWTRVLGWSESELLTRPYASFMHPDDMGPTLAALGRMGETRRPTRFENRIATRDGSWKPIEWTAAPDPGAMEFIAVGRDLSDAKARQAELETTQEALRQAQKMEAMGQLTGGVAHDFNNLLTPIVGSLDLLQRKGVGSEREQRMIDGALQSAERAKTLVQRLLAFARRQPLQPTAVNLPQLIAGMAELLGSTLGPRVNVRLEVADDLPPAKADANQLEMALLNLAVNARDAMKDGGTLTIAAKRESVRAGHRSKLERGHYLRLSIADTGTGMDEATLARAVEPFFSTKGIGKGTGLGLSMVHGLAAQLGGALHIESELGRGTTVEFWLPVSAEPIGGDALMGSAPATVKSRGKALLVDDEELVRMSTADMLKDMGYDVVEVGSGEEAFRLLQTGAPLDLLVTDHLMPGMSGAELARRARSLRPGMPVLIVSGYAEVEGIAADLPRLTKPFRNADLAASLSAITDETDPNSQSGRPRPA